MAILVTCGQCQAGFNARDVDAGKRTRCPTCGEKLVVPGTKAAARTPPSPGPEDAPLAAIVVRRPDATQRGPASRPAPRAANASTGAPARATGAPARAMGAPTRATGAPAGATAAATRVAGAAVSHRAAAVAPVAPPTDRTELARTVLMGFQGPIEQVPVRPGYQIGIVLALIFMLLVPVLYVGLIVAICCLLGYHAVHATSLFNFDGHRGRHGGAVLLYLAPLLAGAILVVFMIKPLFAKPFKRSKPRSLNRSQEPLLFAFVDRVCAAVGSPRPARIDVDCNVNAAAGFRRGIWSMAGDDMVLTIGLPLVAGMNLRQFAGVLAHEFGHFSQGAAMRVSYLLRSLSMWLTRVVYERDEWDARLAAWSRELDFRLGIVLFMARVLVWITRKVLWLLMMLGHFLSGFILRQMEFDADRHEARLAGSDAYESTTRRLHLLDLATQGAFADLSEFYREGRLGDDLPRLIAANADQVPEAALQLINTQIDEVRTGMFDTHPCPSERIANAFAEAAPGVLRVELPANVLFQDFSALSRTCTFDFYREAFGKSFKLTDMHPIDGLLARQEKSNDDVKSFVRYFQGTCSLLRPLALPGLLLTAPTNAAELAGQLRQAREAMLKLVPAYLEEFAAYDQADTDWLEAEAADALHGAKLRVSPSDFKQPLTTRQAARTARADAYARIEAAKPHLAPLENLAMRRLAAALQLLADERVAARIAGAETLRNECPAIVAATAALGGQLNPSIALRNRLSVLSTLLGRFEKNKNHEGLRSSIERGFKQLAAHIRDMQTELSTVRYPFGHAKAEPTLAEFLLPEPFNDADWPAVLAAGESLYVGMGPLYSRLMGWLTSVAEQVETAIGLPRLPDPQKESRS